MNKNMFMAVIAGGITLFVLTGLIHGMLLAGFFANEAVRAEPVWWALTLGQLLSAAFLAVVLGWKGVSSAREAFRPAAMIGALVTLAFNMMMYGVMDGVYTVATVLGDTAVAAVIYGIAGALIAAVLNRGAAQA